MEHRVNYKDNAYGQQKNNLCKTLRCSCCGFKKTSYLCTPNFLTMIAVIKVAGQQFKVEKDQTLFVPHLGGNAGDSVNLDVLLAYADNKISVGADIATKVSAEILDHVKGDTVIAYKTKRRKGFRKKKGHRTSYTKIKVTDIA